MGIEYSPTANKNDLILIETIRKAEEAIELSNIPVVAQWKVQAWPDNSLTFKVWTKGYNEARKFYPVDTVEDMTRRIVRTIDRIGMLRGDLL